MTESCNFFVFYVFELLSDAEHQQADWKGIHEKICQLLVPIRTSTLSSYQRAGHIENRLKKVLMYVTHWDYVCLNILNTFRTHFI